jgi:hypothetical protein
METKKIYIAELARVHVICSQCGRDRQIETRNIHELSKTYRVKCACGNEFQAQFEQRKEYRKPTDLGGACHRLGGPKQDFPIKIKDLSRSGVGFLTSDPTDLKPSDLLELQFELDNPNADHLVCKAIVKNVVKQNFVGAEFVNVSEHFQKQLGFYMMG